MAEKKKRREISFEEFKEHGIDFKGEAMDMGCPGPEKAETVDNDADRTYRRMLKNKGDK